MKRTELKRKTGLKSKTPLKGHKMLQNGLKAKKPSKLTTKTKRAKKADMKKKLCEQYGLPIIPCSRWGTGKNPTRTDLFRGMLWTVFSKYIRERDRDLPCISCSKHHESKQAGHYVPVGNSSVVLWFLEENVNGECPPCNGFDSYHLVPMRKNLIRKYGEEIVDKLDELAAQKSTIKLPEEYYVDLIREYL
jgi:hypothetical protein